VPVLSVATAVYLATQCAPSVAPGTLLSIANTESSLSTLAIHDNTTHQTYHPDTSKAAEIITAGLLSSGHSVDAGIMQINSSNFASLGVSSENAFDPCVSMRAGAALLTQAYLRCRSDGADEQGCIRQAASSYNTGNIVAGFYNGYVHRVELSARFVVPEIHVAGGPLPDAPPATASPVVPACPAIGSDDGWHTEATDPGCNRPDTMPGHVSSNTAEGIHQ